MKISAIALALVLATPAMAAENPLVTGLKSAYEQCVIQATGKGKYRTFDQLTQGLNASSKLCDPIAVQLKPLMSASVYEDFQIEAWQGACETLNNKNLKTDPNKPFQRCSI